MTRFSIIVATAGRPTLARTLRSIAVQRSADDEIVVTGARCSAITEPAAAVGARFIEDGPFGCYGQRERQAAMAHATGTHLSFMDDDDYYTDGAFDAMRSAVNADPETPQMFQMIEPSGLRIWMEPAVACGNVSGTQFVVPNDPAKLGTWGFRREGDFDFICSTLPKYGWAMRWQPIVIAGCRDQGVAAGV